jgi:hypothetical protein
MTHPYWPDGAKVELDHLCRRDGDPDVYRIHGIHSKDGRAYISASLVGAPPGNLFANATMDRLTRVPPTRPVDSEEYRTAASPKALGQLFNWAKQLLVVDAEIVDDDEPRCDATRGDGHDTPIWTCDQPAGHLPGCHHDPERGWW